MLHRLRLVLGVAVFVWTIAALLGAGSSASAASTPQQPCRLTAANTLAAVECAQLRPVPSLEPAATNKLWRKLVRAARRTDAVTATTDCRPLRAIFYTATDWMRLATKLAKNGSPCAQYYFSIPPLVADKTQSRPDQAWRIRDLGPNFHAMAEIHMATWGTWVADTGRTWYEAGVEARRSMRDAGYDVALGDTWAVNEASSAVRRGDGTARADLRELVRGLFQGDGTTARGTVFIIGMGQGTLDPAGPLSTYKTTLKNWLQDTAFWADMNLYVSDWAQEVYGDFRNYGVAGQSLATRRDYLNDYLQHFTVLAGVGPDTIATARSYLQAAYSPLANAAWQFDSGYGWTLISADQMKHFVSAQTYALRHFSGTSSQALQDRGGFAWKPNNATGIPSADFTTQSGEIADRLGAAIHDSGQPLDPSDPGIGACGLGQNLWCAGEIAGAWFNEAWKTFRTWEQPTLAFATVPQMFTAGIPSGFMAVQLQTSSGAAQTAASAVTVNLSSSSAQGAFSASASAIEPWPSTLSVTIPAGSSTSGSFYYRDTKAGSPTLTASATGATSGTQTETVNPGLLASVAVSPSSASVVLGGTQTFTANGADAYGNAVTIASASWSVSAPGTVSPTGNPTTFTASSTTTGSGSVSATVGTVIALEASVTVVAAQTVSVSSITYKKQKQDLLVTVALNKAVAGASVSISLYLKGSLYTSATGTTGTGGKVTFKATNAPSGCYTTTVTNVAASGFTWDGKTPANQFCF